MVLEQTNCLLLEINSSLVIDALIQSKESITLTDLEKRINDINNDLKNGILEVVFSEYKNYL